VRITYDDEKRAKTLEERGLDFEDAAVIFEGQRATRADNRRDYGEPRFKNGGHVRRWHGGGYMDAARRRGARYFDEVLP
jgi:uncharacterized DUF497 family protein